MALRMDLLDIAQALGHALADIGPAGEVTHVYHPYQYAWRPAARYLTRYGRGRKRILLVGMNPGPFGMVQTGIPFGDVGMVRDFLRIEEAVQSPAGTHPSRPVHGFGCQRREISGQRLWSFVASTFGTPEQFFRDYFVYNYCPLAFVGHTGKNITPVDLPRAQAKPIEAACDLALKETVAALGVTHVIGIGGFAAKRCQQALGKQSPFVFGQVLHPSPASPAANRGWAPLVAAQLSAMGLPLGPNARRQSAQRAQP